MGSTDGWESALSESGAVFDHVAHAVPSIRSVVPLYRDLLGGTLAGGGFNPWGGHLAVHFVVGGGGRIELLEPIRADSQSVGSFLARNPRGGLHHLTFKVADLASCLASLSDYGLEPFGTKVDEENWKETYLHPRQTGGVLIQLAESGPGIPPPFTEPLDVILDRAAAMREGRGAPPAG
ncbi:MAG TPA: VOC family protein [Acidimicrobiales bacterium]|nr:VOC family protein [Acidimicrobiales bacterium]